MARTLYSTLFARARGATAGITLAVPLGHTYVLRDLDVYANNDPFSTVRVYLEGDLGQAIAFLDFPNNFEGAKQWTGRQVIESGGSFGVQLLGGAACDFSLSGYDLINP